jgi:protein arginine kinase activator
MHKGTRHVGKTPAGAPPPPPPPPSKRAAKAEAAGPGAAKAELQQQLKLQMLQAKLAQAIKAEDFEQAAKFRDEIKAFNASLTPPATA